MPYTEAVLLSIYFEETGAYQYRKNKEMESQAGSASRGDERVDIALSDDDPNEAVYADFEE